MTDLPYSPLYPDSMDGFWSHGNSLETTQLQNECEDFQRSFDSKNTNEMEERIVIIFGFPIEKITAVLKFFEQYGTIVQHWVPDKKSNWIQVEFNTSIDAQVALNKNGAFVDGIIIGVKKNYKDMNSTLKKYTTLDCLDSHNPSGALLLYPLRPLESESTFHTTLFDKLLSFLASW